MDGKYFLMLSELFEQFRLQALMLLKDAEESGFLDELTGCYNRKAYDIRKTQLPEANVGVIFVDVNGLKQVNDKQGHKAGDVLLCNLGKMLKAYFGGNDTFRVGGDEFVIFKVNIKPEVLKAIVDEFKLAIDTMHKTTVAIGYSLTSVDKHLEEAITEAELKMYKNKLEFYEKFPECKR